METKPTFTYGIKGKLVSAVCMLLVGVIMVVSSTYAWFTLSTAPEVTGISTAIGANGALEIRLNDTGTYSYKNNTTWGNIVDLSGPGYGLANISLLPSELNAAAAGMINRTNPLLYPQYGADGRITNDSGNAMTGKFVLDTPQGTTGSFKSPDTSDTHGVLAVGAASGMTERQMAFRNARSAANNAMALAINLVSNSLKTQGGTMAGIVVTQMAANSPTSAVTAEEVAGLWEIIVALQAALVQIEEAYEQQIIAVAASETGGGNQENLHTAVAAAIEAGTITLQGIAESDGISGGGLNYDLTGTALLAGIKDYIALKAEVATAADLFTTTDADATTEGVQPLKKDDGTFNATTWTGVRPIINELIDYTAANQVKINDTDLATADRDAFKDKIVNDVAAGRGVNLTLGPGSGLYASMAEQTGNFDTDIVVPQVSYGGITVKNMAAHMETAATAGPHLSLAATMVGGLGSPTSDSGSADMPLTEFYGYILDFAFRTNAAGSNLLLQTDAADRIYDDNDNPDTQGHGSNMSFTAASSQVTATMIQNLMKCIRVVFFTDAGVLVEARLDTDDAEIVDNSGIVTVTAKLYIYKAGGTETQYTYTPTAGGDPVRVYPGETEGTYHTVLTGQSDENKVDMAAGAVAEQTVTTGGFEKEQGNAVISALPQNVETKISALVYLDGNALENEDVAYNTDNTATGTLNLQFASDATLTPMKYGGLYQPGSGTTTPPATENQDGEEATT